MGIDNKLWRVFAAIVLSGAPSVASYLYEQPSEAGHISGGYSLTSTALPQPRYAKLAEINASRVQELWRDTSKFVDWEKFERLVKRLSRARVAADAVDAHLDYGIIAESVLTHSDSQQSEISHRVSLRAAWLLGDSPSSRKKVADRAKRLYRFRSSAAHKGRLPTAKGNEGWLEQDREDADNLCTELLLATLRLGEFQSDWDSLVYGQSGAG